MPVLRDTTASRVAALPLPAAGRAALLAARRRLAAPLGWRRRRVFLLAFAAIVVLSLAWPDSAAAFPSVDDIINKAIDKISKKFFGVSLDGFNGTFFTWLVNAPNFAGKANGHLDGKLETFGHVTQGIGFALIGAVMTFSALQYWLSGIADLSGDGSELLQGLTRGIGAALLITAWPWIFENAIAVSNQVTAVLVDGRDLDKLAAMIVGALGVATIASTGLGIVFMIILGLATAFVVMGLIAMKVAIGATLAILYAGMPLAIVLMPIDATAWVARLAVRSFVAVLLVPIIWALCLGTFVAVGVDSATFGGGGTFVDKLVKPLTALALLWLMFSLPRSLMRIAALGAIVPGSGGGRRGGVVMRMSERFGFQAINQHIPQEWGGNATPPGDRGPRDGGPTQSRPPAGGGPDGPSGGTPGGGPSGGGAMPPMQAGNAEAGAAATSSSAGTGAATGAGTGAATGAGTGVASGAATGASTGAVGGPAGMAAGAAVGAAASRTGSSGGGLPGAPGMEEAGHQMRERQADLAGMSPEGRMQAGREALERLGQAGYADDVVGYTASHTPEQTTERMTQAGAAEGVAAEDSAAFLTWGALDADTRGELVTEATGVTGGGGADGGAAEGGAAGGGATGGSAGPGGADGAPSQGGAAAGGGGSFGGADFVADGAGGVYDAGSGAPWGAWTESSSGDGGFAATPPRDHVRTEDIGVERSGDRHDGLGLGGGAATPDASSTATVADDPAFDDPGDAPAPGRGGAGRHIPSPDDDGLGG